MSYKNIAGRFFGLVIKHACDRRTDGRTDGQNYDSQDRTSIAASRGNERLVRVPNIKATQNTTQQSSSVVDYVKFRL